MTKKVNFGTEPPLESGLAFARGSFARAVGLVALLRLSGGALLFLSQLLLAAWMGAADFGAYSLAWACVAVLATLAGLGLPGTCVRYISSYRAEGNHERLRGLLEFSRRRVLLTAAAIAIVGIVLAPVIAADSPYRNTLRLAFLAIPALALLNLDAACARGFNWMALSTMAEQIVRPVVLILLAAMLVAWAPMSRAEYFVLACAGAYFLAALAQHHIVKRRIRSILPDGATLHENRAWTSVSAAMLVLNGSQVIRANMDPILLGMLLSPEDVGIYTAAFRTATLVSFVFMISSVAAQPTISSLHVQESSRELSRFVATATRGVFLASLLAGLTLAVAGPLILRLFGPGFVSGYPSLLILIGAHVLVAAFGPLGSVLIMTGRQRSAAYVSVAALPLQAALSTVLIGLIGIQGAALGTGAGLLLTQLTLYVLAKRKSAP